MLITRGDKKPAVPIKAKILLSLNEVQELIRLSKVYLRSAINQGSLKPKQIEMSWQIIGGDLFYK
ncbi:hypothetical protein Riv7116_6928 (plasmid) [Rivularia sp. PCC 7116]|uniref:hypothetical protein n=1 Tax=Rivularia sp. PCC 7116 TaxID=373994 RepID=UPI00029F077C|nr:hypothetical protein [Rivularia sp. PCC 7116]AFY59240.1 hypothetical protein Riv7116_6928 [Rivularia sp. PCC 7116]